MHVGIEGDPVRDGVSQEERSQLAEGNKGLQATGVQSASSMCLIWLRSPGMWFKLGVCDGGVTESEQPQTIGLIPKTWSIIPEGRHKLDGV